MIVEKKTLEDYENSYHTEFIITAEYGFEEHIIESYLKGLSKECKATLRRLTKGDTNEQD